MEQRWDSKPRLIRMLLRYYSWRSLVGAVRRLRQSTDKKAYLRCMYLSQKQLVKQIFHRRNPKLEKLQQEYEERLERERKDQAEVTDYYRNEAAKYKSLYRSEKLERRWKEIITEHPEYVTDPKYAKIAKLTRAALEME